MASQNNQIPPFPNVSTTIRSGTPLKRKSELETVLDQFPDRVEPRPDPPVYLITKQVAMIISKAVPAFGKERTMHGLVAFFKTQNVGSTMCLGYVNASAIPTNSYKITIGESNDIEFDYFKNNLFRNIFLDVVSAADYLRSEGRHLTTQTKLADIKKLVKLSSATVAHSVTTTIIDGSNCQEKVKG